MELNNVISATQPFDISYIKKACRGDEGMIREMLLTFVESMADATREISSAYLEHNLEEVRKIAHRIKPVLNIYYISDAHACAMDIENLASGNINSPELEKKIITLKERVSYVTQLLTKQYLSDKTYTA